MPPTRPFRFAAQVSNAPSGEEWAALARKVEDLGYSTLSIPDHFDDQLATMPALVAAAMATSSLRVGSLVFDNDYKHPLVLAKECATLDLLSGGRLELGLGAGWMRTDYEQSGMAYDPPGTRIDRMLEGLTVIRGLFSGEPFSFSGKHYTITDHVGTPRPVQRPHPPILIGGGGRRVLSIAAREADIISVNFDLRVGAVTPEVAPSGTAEATKEKIGWIRTAAGSSGRHFEDIELAATIFFAIQTEDREATAEAVAGGFGITAEQALAIPHVLVGTVEEMVEDLQRRREEFGFSYIAFGGGSWEAMAPVVARLAGT
ncbi:MAG: TIGR03621 family F420-dependent LLM class oxidoreductase [Acidimicrobiales bacterium]